MNKSIAGNAISTTEHFKRQLENICRLVQLSSDERRKVDQAIIEQAIIEQACQTRGREEMSCLMALNNGGVLKILIAFNEAAPGGRRIQKILSAQVLG